MRRHETLLASSTKTASFNGDDVANLGYRGGHIVIDVTAASGTSPTLVVTVQGKDPTSGKYYTILASASITGTGTTVLRIFDGATVAANTAANDVLPPVWRVISTIGGTSPSFTYSIGATYIPD